MRLDKANVQDSYGELVDKMNSILTLKELA